MYKIFRWDKRFATGNNCFREIRTKSQVMHYSEQSLYNTISVSTLFGSKFTHWCGRNNSHFHSTNTENCRQSAGRHSARTSNEGISLQDLFLFIYSRQANSPYSCRRRCKTITRAYDHNESSPQRPARAPVVLCAPLAEWWRTNKRCTALCLRSHRR